MNRKLAVWIIILVVVVAVIVSYFVISSGLTPTPTSPVSPVPAKVRMQDIAPASIIYTPIYTYEVVGNPLAPGQGVGLISTDTLTVTFSLDIQLRQNSLPIYSQTITRFLGAAENNVPMTITTVIITYTHPATLPMGVYQVWARGAYQVSDAPMFKDTDIHAGNIFYIKALTYTNADNYYWQRQVEVPPKTTLWFPIFYKDYVPK